MIGPLSGDEAVAIAQLGEAASDEDDHHRHRRVAGSDDADRAEERLPLPRRRRPVERRHRRDRSTRSSAGGRPRSSWTTTASAGRPAAGIIADFCAIGGKITKRVFPPLNTTDYVAVRPAAAAAGQGGRVLLGRRRTGTGPALKAFEQAYGTIKPKQHSGNLFLWFLTDVQDVAPRLDRLVRRRLRHRAGPEARRRRKYRRRHEEVVPGARRASTTASSTTTTRPLKALVAGPERVGRRRRARSCSRRCRGRSRHRSRSRTAGTSSSTRTGRRSRTSSRCRS